MSDLTGAPNPHRLPRTAVPSRYDLELVPDLTAGTFSGTARIAVDIVEATDALVLHAAELEIDEATITGADGSTATLTAALDDDLERLTLTSQGEPMRAGEATLDITFRGVLNDKLRGFYRSRFTDAEGVERTLATTQFESTDARRAFPCWDEPDFKAVFGVTLVVPDDLLALSNGAEVERAPAGEHTVRVRFADTMVMSTYLVAFVVGPLEATRVVDVDGVPLRVVHPLGKAHLADFGLDIGASALRYFSSYYGIPYPGDKVDLVAIPDFAFGAMENLGCITFRETALLVDPATATQPELERVADVVAHELAHMWFGDLVTMKWWTGIWLNEAFATFMEMLAVDHFRPDWKRWSTFALGRSAAFDTDALAATRPIEYEVLSPADAEGMFDILTYEKGAAVLRMLEQYLGAEPFRKGISAYLEEHAYGNTETTDLWDALEAATGEPVRRVADTWIYQGGHPEVHVAFDDATSELVLTQRLFRYLPDPSHQALWEVPVGIRWADDDGNVASLDVLLSEREARVALPSKPTWLVANRDAAGFFRTDYDPELRDALAAVALDVLDPTERYTLVDDTWATVLSGAADSEAIASVIRALAADDDVSVWRRIIGSLATLNRIAADDERFAVQSLAAEVLGPLADRIGESPASDESEQVTNLRAAVFEALGLIARHASVTTRARSYVDAMLDGDTTIDPALGDASVRVVAADLDDALFDRFLAASETADTPQEQLRYLAALGDADDPAVFERFLGMLLGERVRTQDAGGLLNRALTNRANAAAAWGFAETNWDELVERLPNNAISRMITGVRTFTDATLAQRVEDFLGSHEVPQATKAFSQHIERMQVTVALANRERGRLTTLLR